MADFLRALLSIDGGGIRGLVPALVLEELEKRRLKAKGKIRAAARLFRPDRRHLDRRHHRRGPDRAPPARHQPAGRDPGRLVALYRDQGGDIFDRSFFRAVRKGFGSVFSGNFSGVVEEKYTHGPLEEKLKKTLGGRRISDALTSLLITAYDIGARTTVTMKKRPLRPGEQPHDDYLFWQGRARPRRRRPISSRRG